MCSALFPSKHRLPCRLIQSGTSVIGEWYLMWKLKARHAVQPIVHRLLFQVLYHIVHIYSMPSMPRSLYKYTYSHKAFAAQMLIKIVRIVSRNAFYVTVPASLCRRSMPKCSFPSLPTRTPNVYLELECSPSSRVTKSALVRGSLNTSSLIR